MKTALRLSAALLCAAAMFTTQDAAAKSGFPAAIPNGSTNNCASCHVSPGGGGSRNAFGDDVRNTLERGNPAWSALFNLDSDGDGYSNGVELGDAAGAWMRGAQAGAYVSHPGVASSTPCGNGRIDAKVSGMEECDGAELGGKTCADFGGSADKTPTCTATCTIDAASCAAPPDPDMGQPVPDMGRDMGGQADMGQQPQPDMGQQPQPDMGQQPQPDMGQQPQPDMATTLPAPKTQEDDDGCSATGVGSPAAPGSLALLGLLGLVGLRRRRA